MDTETKPLWTTTREAMGKTYEIELWADDGMTADGSRLYGNSNYTEQRVRVNTCRRCDGRYLTLLHELFHLVASETGDTVEEEFVERFTSILYSYLRGFGLWQEFPWPDKDD